MRQEQRNSLIEYGLLTFGIAWGLIAAYVMVYLLTGAWLGTFSYRHPVFWIAGYGALIGALIAVFRRDDVNGLLDWLRISFALHNIWWAIAAFVTIPALSALLSLMLGIPVNPGALENVLWKACVVFLAFAALAEEIGWRGMVYPTIADVLPLSSASLLTGVLVFIWRLPAVLLMLSSGEMQLPLLNLVAVFLLILAVSLLNSWLYRRQQQSVLYGILLNWSTLIAVYALGIEAILVAGISVLLAVALIIADKVNLDSSVTNRQIANEPLRNKDAGRQTTVQVGTVLAVLVALVGVGLLVAIIIGGEALADYVTSIPLPEQLSPLLVYAATAITWTARTAGGLMLAAALMVAVIVLLVNRALNRISFLNKRIRILENQVQKLQDSVSEHREDDRNDS